MAMDDLIVDVSDPAAAGLNGAWALLRGAGHGAANATNLQNIVNDAVTNNPDTALTLIFPVGYWAIADTVTWPNVNSFRVIGLGGMCKGLSQMTAHNGACTFLVWEGGTTGPMFRMQNTDGDVWENLNFDGFHGPDTNSLGPDDGLDVLILHERSGAGSGALYHHYQNCTFFRAQKLFMAGGGSGGAGTAEFTFSKCLFNCGETSAKRWTSAAFYTDNPQCVNVLFDSNCEFNNCGYCAYLKDTGRCVFDKPTIAIVGTILCRDGGGQNTAGDGIFFPHLDGGSASEGRKQLYKSVNPESTMGPVVIETPKYGAVGATADEFSVITSFTGSALVLTSAIRMRVGDRVMFLPKDDIDAGEVHGVGKLETTIATRTNDTTYTTTDSVSALGITDIADWYVCNGEALIECVSSDFIHMRNTWLSGEHIWGGRLARLTHSNWTSGRSPKLRCENLMCAELGVDFTVVGVATLLSITGTAYWRLEHVDGIADSVGAPRTFGNFGDFGQVVVVEPEVVDVNFERVPIERTFVLFPSDDEGLVAEAVKSFAIDSNPLIAIEFVHDMPVGGYIASVATPTIESGPPGGLMFSIGRDRSQAKVHVTTVSAGLYVLSQNVTYDDGSTATGRITFEVVE